jgi:hypothetical protein
MANAPKDPATMTAAQINAELDRLDVERGKANDTLIEAGRGSETAEETGRKPDPLAMRWRVISDRQYALRAEISRRYGPGAPSRLPKGRGFGPRSTS